MRDWGYPPSLDDLVAVTLAAEAFHDAWASINPPFPAVFDGSVADVQALDHLEYEGIPFPTGGIEAAALICGEVLRRAAGFEWVVAHRGDWLVATPEGRWPGIAVCPLARLHEMECGGTPQFRRYSWFLHRAALDCLLFCDGEHEAALQALIAGSSEYLDLVERTLRQIR